MPRSFERVKKRESQEVYPAEATTNNQEPETWCTTSGDGTEVYWTYQDGEWHTQDPEGIWWTYSEARPWMDVNDIMATDAEAGRELSEILAALQDAPFSNPGSWWRPATSPEALSPRWQVKTKRQGERLFCEREVKGLSRGFPYSWEPLQPHCARS